MLHMKHAFLRDICIPPRYRQALYKHAGKLQAQLGTEVQGSSIVRRH